LLDHKNAKTDATKVLAKLSSELVQMELLQKQKGVKDLPGPVKARLLDTHTQIKLAVANCKLVLAGKSASPPNMQDAIDLARRTKLQQQFVAQLLANNLVMHMP
jgi:hypothetical protein